ncbi:MAG: peptide-methionine (R)-S-oxide reductase MsrB [Bdellovibrionales bacterium]|nr:peptide-methionine (R)-S-oxide reductase MsrB [Bdellovibrionales bacterium]
MASSKKKFPIQKSEDEWKQQLTPEQYTICRQKGTERAFTGQYFDCKEPGTYYCVCCGNKLFTSDTKYNSGCGWPSFVQPVQETALDEFEDRSHFMIRTEVVCSKCGSHLGHVFPDMSCSTGRSYCINSASLVLKKSSLDD